MENIAIIAEYNPLHNGHLYQMSRLEGENNVIVALSGNFTERGDIAVASKYRRAAWAVKHGASLVVEIPAFGVLSCAEHYARCAAKVLSLLGCVDKLSFGSEAGDIDVLKKIALNKESNSVKDSLQELMKDGLSYPAALSKALSDNLDIVDADKILASPNNILGIEYIRALSGTNIEPTTIKRMGNNYSDNEINLDSNYASATSIRAHLSSDDVASYLPSDVLSEARQISINEDALFHSLYSELIVNNRDISAILNIGEGIDNRIREALKNSDNYGELLTNIKTKRYTLSRIKRTILDIVLGIKSDMKNYIDSIDYATVLAVKRDCLSMLGNINGYVITKYNDYAKTNHPFKDIDLRSNNLYNLVSSDKITSHQMIIVD